MRMARAVTALGVLALLVATAAAQVPAKMNYQVMLTDNSDQPLADQVVEIDFRLYSSDVGGSLYWTETHNTTTNSIGVVSVVLGETTPLPGDGFSVPLWLEIEVSGEVMAPRRELVSAPYALHSADSDCLGDEAAIEYVLDEDLATPGGINNPSNPVDWTMLKSVPAGFADGSDDVGGAGDGHSLDASDGSPVDAVYVDADGIVEFGSSVSSGVAQFYAGGGGNPSLELIAHPSHGGMIELYEESGAQYGGLEPDFNGTGGFLWIDNGSGGSGFYVDGNAVSGDAQVGIYGTASSTYFNTYSTGDDAVDLPWSSVSSTEMQNEPGVNSTSTITLIDLAGGIEPLLSRTIYVPASGFVVAVASAQAYALHDGVNVSSAYFGLSDAGDSFPTGASVYHRVPADAGGGSWYPGVSVTWMFETPSAGAYTFYFAGEQVAGDWLVARSNMSLMYFPTYYGLLAKPLAGPEVNPEGVLPPGGPALTEADIAAERAESEAANDARIERELAEMEAKIAEIRASMGNGNKR